MAGKPVVCLDFDGVLAHYDGWKGELHLGKPLDGSLDFIRTHSRRYRFVIHTVREPRLVEQWLSHHGFPALPVMREKPKAIAYVDDRSIRFDGDWTALTEALKEPPWWKK
ncbi:MAG: hypothetical protein ACM32O_04305 [Clostridia bacterium]